MNTEALTSARILLVDDHPANVLALEAILAGAGARSLISTTDPRQVLPLLRQHSPDLVLLDWMMPVLDGASVLRQIQAVLPPDTYLPILVLTADNAPATKQQALAAGAHDFLTKPLDPIEVVLRCQNLIATRRLHRQLQQHNTDLAGLVAARTQALEAAHLEILERLARAVEARDDVTGQHTLRVARTAAQLAALLGLDAGEVALYHQTAGLHDVGKIAIPDYILDKPGPLEPEEWAIMQQHTTRGAYILADSPFRSLQLAQEIALTHHERWDGQGYPRGLAGAAIPLSGRIVAVADVFDALTHARPYKAAWPHSAARAEIAAQSGQQFDPQVVQAFLHGGQAGAGSTPWAA